MDSFLPNTTKFLLGVLATAFLLFVVVQALTYMNRVKDTINKDMEATRYQKEYASLRRFESDTISIAYTEVLDAAYTISEKTRPVLIVDDTFWCTNKPDVGAAALLRFPLPVSDLRTNFGLNNTQTFTAASIRGIWDSVPYDATTDESSYKAISEWLADQSRTHSKLSYRGFVLRNDSGSAYAIVFVYQSGLAPAACF